MSQSDRYKPSCSGCWHVAAPMPHRSVLHWMCASVQQPYTEPLGPGLQRFYWVLLSKAQLKEGHFLLLLLLPACAGCKITEIYVGPETGASICPSSQVSSSQVFSLVPIHSSVYPCICMRSTNSRKRLMGNSPQSRELRVDAKEKSQQRSAPTMQSFMRVTHSSPCLSQTITSNQIIAAQQ